MLSALVLLMSLKLVAHADILRGQVVVVSDGDTITVLDEMKQRQVIRLIGIDAPEKAQAFGQKAKESLSDLVFNKDVSITWFKKDRYRRTVDQVYSEDIDVGLEQIKRGLAWHNKQYERDQSVEDRSSYSIAEEQARIARTGVWSQELPIEPSNYRRLK
jgi:endonuclease YncB( thermonuclease family)